MGFHGAFQFEGGRAGATLGPLSNAAISNNALNLNNENAPESSILGEFGAANLALGGLKTLGSLWNSFQQHKLAKKTLKFQKDAFQTNLKNSIKVYNTSLRDRLTARGVAQNQTPEEAQEQFSRNKL